MTPQRRDFHRIAIVNRGEAAMRLINAVRELNRASDNQFSTIALFTAPDRRAMFVREADEAVDLGTATFIDPRDGSRKSSYLDYARLERALVEARADAAWVGWGFVAEHAEFADLCRQLGIVFIGPEPNVMRWLGDKIAAKHVAERVGVPVVPWSDNPVDSDADALIWAGRLGYPLMIKASAGGGGRGMRLAHSDAELCEGLERARAEALQAFGDATLFLERVITGARHVEVQVIGDHYGTIWPLGVRDCTIQRRHQKVLEESPSPVLSPAMHEALQRDAVRLCGSAGYQNAGTVEFLFTPRTQAYYFMEVNTRLQVEHPVTELVTGLDLVKLQLHVARGGRLDGEPPSPIGHAVEVRLNAENPDNAFAPAPGVVELFRMPTGPGLRIDTGVAEGDAVPAEFDSMLAKVIAHGRDRAEAFARLRRGLGQSLVVVRGGASNKGFLLDLLGRPEVQRAEVDNSWLDALVARGAHINRRHADVALLQAAIDVGDAELELERTQFCTSATRGRPRVRPDTGRTVELRAHGNRYRIGVWCRGPNEYRLTVDGQAVDVMIERLNGFERWLRCGGERRRILSVTQGLYQLVEVDGVAHQISRDDGGLVRAPSPAVVLDIRVQPGDVVAAGERLVVLEAMKMELPVLAPVAGRVRRVLINRSVQVDTGAPLVLLDPLDGDSAGAADERVRFDLLVEAAPADGTAQERCLRALDALRRLILGFDVPRDECEALIAAYRADCGALAADDASVQRAENDLLETFADLCALFRRAATDESDGEGTLGTQEYLIAYLRGLDGRGEGLPPAFLQRLQSALRHYGIAALDRTPALEEGLLRIYKAHQHPDIQAMPALAVLERRLRCLDALQLQAGEPFRALLDRLIAAAEGRAPAVGELAREVRYRYFDYPLFAAARRRVYEAMEVHLVALARRPDTPDRADRVRELVECPQPLVSLLIGRLPNAAPAMRELLLEVLTRRYYRIRQLKWLRVHALDGQSCAAAEYNLDDRPIRVIATFGTYDRLGEVTAAVRGFVRDLPADCDVVVDLYVASAQPLGDPDATQRAVQEVLNRTQFERPLRRIVVVLSAHGAGWGMSGVQHFTYRLGPDGYAEEKLYRGLHPMMGKRMHLWRLANFDIERLPSVEDVYLFRAVARENPKDERLVALAEVRDLTPVRDEAGRIVALPYLERMLMEALAAIRRVQLQRPAAGRLFWNRVLLYLWPPLLLQLDEFNDLTRRLAPATAGLGLEQVVMRARTPDPYTDGLRDTVLGFTTSPGSGLVVTSGPPPTEPLHPLGEYDQKVLRMRRRGLMYPYEIVRMLTPSAGGVAGEFPPGEFAEYDLDQRQRLVPVDRPYGENAANVVVGVIRNVTGAYPDGMTRVIVLGDPSRAMGAVAEPECRRIIAALDLAEQLGVPLEWFPISAGAKISMDSGTENMDWIALVLRRLIEFTQAGGEINVVVNGINVGAQPYWNAEATMLLHTRGILIMTPEGAMVLTGKQALDYSGSVSAEDNQGIGGYERIMGPNGQAQYFARDLAEACRILLHHYALTYVLRGERFPRREPTADPPDRDVCASPHEASGDDAFHVLGDIFSNEKNPGRKRPFDVRTVMRAVIDQDLPPLERWTAMRNAEIAVVWDAHLGGYPVCLIGFESRPLPRFGFLPADGPDHWTAGTLFPMSSKKVARAITGASANRPLVILANLSGFDGSPESMRELQLEYGAEIGRAVVSFKGPIVFCVISRYHGGAYVVFSTKLNEQIEAAALEGSYASVIGGAPAAAVVFAGEVEARTKIDPRIVEIDRRLAQADAAQKSRLRTALAELRKEVHSEKLGEVADEFDRIHSIYRAREMGSLHHVIPAARLRPYLIEAVERGMARMQRAEEHPESASA